MLKQCKSIFKDEFKTYTAMRKAELSTDAYRHCRRTVSIFDDYLFRINMEEKSLDERIVDEWIKEISKEISPNTVRQYVYYIRHLLLYLRNIGFKCFVPKTIATKDMYVPYIYSDDEIIRIIQVADSFKAPRAVKNIYIENEMPLLVRLLLCCGLRLGEALSLKIGDIDFDRNLIVLRVTKKYKQRLVPFEDSLSDIIYRYCSSMGILGNSKAYLFPTANPDTHLQTNCARNYFRGILKDAGIQISQKRKYQRGACLHCFRHTFAVKSFDKNNRNNNTALESVPFLSTYLGHDSLYETEKYLKYSGNYFSDTLSKFETFAGDLFPEVAFDE